MAFRPPTFNLSCNLWRTPNVYANPPDGTFNVNLSCGRRVLAVNAATIPLWGKSVPVELLCPALTDIIGVIGPNATDMVEVPAGSGRCYAVVWVEDVGKGFTNEYRLALLLQMTLLTQTGTTNPWTAPLWPVPTP